MIIPYDFATPAYLEGLELRKMVLREPLGLNIYDDPLEQEYDQLHFGLYAADRMVGTCTLKIHSDGSLQMRQVAVHPEFSRKGYGQMLVEYCQDYALRQGASRLFCHARDIARPFYERCGWQSEGEQYIEVGIPHYTMYWPQLAS
jgi:GNAT superfamily N-acetyltransferase